MDEKSNKVIGLGASILESAFEDAIEEMAIEAYVYDYSPDETITLLYAALEEFERRVKRLERPVLADRAKSYLDQWFKRNRERDQKDLESKRR